MMGFLPSPFIFFIETSIDESALKDLLKAAVLEALQEHRDLLKEIVKEAMEDIALTRAIDEGLRSESAPGEEILTIMGDAG
jgi:hypothetical protein